MQSADQRAEARRTYTTWSTIQQEFFNVDQWPRWARLLWWNTHKSNNDTFKMWMFFWANGAMPSQATLWTVGRCDRDVFHIDRCLLLEQQVYTRAGAARMRAYPTFDIQLGRVPRATDWRR